MPSNVVNVGDIVGPDTIFKLPDPATGEGEVELRLAGDLDTEHVFAFLDLIDRFNEAQEEINAAVAAAKTAAEEAGKDAREVARDVRAAQLEQSAAIKALIDEVRAKLLAAFRQRQPDLADLPFGHKATMVMLGHVLQAIGVTGDPPAGKPVPKKKAPARKKAAAKKSAARKGTGSR